MDAIFNLSLLRGFSGKRARIAIGDPWLGWLHNGIAATSSLILINTGIVFILAVINAFAVNIPIEKSDYIEKHTMLLRGELIFFWCTIPLVYLIANISESRILWTGRLRPLYVISAGVIAINVWILQLGLWGPCVLAVGNGKSAPTYCPYVYRSPDIDVRKEQSAGQPTMEIYAVPTLFVLYVCYLAIGAVAMHRERKKPETYRPAHMRRSYTIAPHDPKLESLAMGSENAWPSLSTNVGGEDAFSESYTNRDTDVALTVTTPHGTTEVQRPFDEPDGRQGDPSSSAIGNKR